MTGRRFTSRRVHGIIVAALLLLVVFSSLKDCGGQGQPSTYCGFPVCHSYSTPGTHEPVSHPLRNLRKAITGRKR